MKKIIILCLGFAFMMLSSCNKDEVSLDSEMNHENHECSNVVCDPDNQSFNTPDCRPVHFGHFELSELSKTRFADFHLPKGDTVTFYSPDSVQGFVIETIFQNDPSTGYASRQTMKKCKCDDDRYLRYCLMNTTRNVRYLSIEDSTDFLLSLSTWPDIRQEVVGAVGDVLSICRNANCNMKEFFAVIDQRSLSYSMQEGEEYFSIINLNDQSYSNVISYTDEDAISEIYKFYYQLDFGLLAFKDANDVIWIRQ